MSKFLELAAKEVDKTEFAFNQKGDIEIQDAFIFWKNFKGEKNLYGNSQRNFTLAVPPVVAQQLKERGWNVTEKYINKEDPELGTINVVNIKVSMDSMYPPEIALFSEFKGQMTKKVLDEDTVGILDGTEFLRVDIIVHESRNKIKPGMVSGYVKKLYAIQDPDSIFDFDGRYSEYEQGGEK